ncbi:MAG: hypothetical protein WBB94_00840 [Candidatus Saccharimonadaceae bacterium]
MVLNSKVNDRGATALFVVLFATLLMSVLAIGFMRLMVQEQIRAIDNDLSQSAYDSAVAGVEDAKRVIRACQNAGYDPMNDACKAMVAGKCNTVSEAGLANDSGGEVLIQTSNGVSGAEMDQAYTCVQIAMNTEDYLADVSPEKSLIVPLKAKTSFNKIIISWQLSTDGLGDDLENPDGDSPVNLIKPALYSNIGTAWEKTPALVRAQFITPDSAGFTLADLDESSASSTTFLYPHMISTASSVFPIGNDTLSRYTQSASDPWLPGTNSPLPVSCYEDRYQLGGYACMVEITLDTTIAAESNLAVLRLSTLYQANTSVSIQLRDTTNSEVLFSGVQPSVDSTGRANNVFRRVESRLSLGGGFAFPERALDLKGSLCKNFYVTSDEAGSVGATDCEP